MNIDHLIENIDDKRIRKGMEQYYVAAYHIEIKDLLEKKLYTHDEIHERATQYAIEKTKELARQYEKVKEC